MTYKKKEYDQSNFQQIIKIQKINNLILIYEIFYNSLFKNIV